MFDGKCSMAPKLHIWQNIYEDLCFEKKNELRRKKTVTDVTRTPANI